MTGVELKHIREAKQMFQIFYKTTNEECEPWKLYGSFETEAEWQKEQAHIRFLRSMSPVYLMRKHGKPLKGSKYREW